MTRELIALPFGFRIVGDLAGMRRTVDAAAALAGYACCDPRAEVGAESYLSAFQFGDDFRDLLDHSGSVRGFDGPCWAPFVWFDLDDALDPGKALDGARRLAAFLLERYRALDEAHLLLFFSGSKGFHVGLPTVWNPAPSPDFHRVARCLAERLAALAGVVIDRGVYDKVRAFRAPNSRHPKTGLHKRRLSFGELTGLSLDGIRGLAQGPEPFELPIPSAADPKAAEDWRDAQARVIEQAEGKARQRTASDGLRLNRLTLDFIREGATEPNRHRTLFSAAANLAEFGCPPTLAHALLTDAALDCGLPPGDVRRQIECGLAHGANPSAPPCTAADAPAPAPDPDAARRAVAALWKQSETPVGPEAEDQTEDPPTPPWGDEPAERVCYWCRGSRFWRSVHGGVNCANCHPPATPELVAEWMGGKG